MNKNKKFSGFTLAEVLITIGVIGVVAAMTIPTIMANIKGQRYRSQFKKTMSTLNQAVRMNQANYDWNFGDLSEDCVSNDTWKIHTAENNKSFCAIFNSNLKGISHGIYSPDNSMEPGETYNEYYGFKPSAMLNDNYMGGLIKINPGDWGVINFLDGSTIAFNYFVSEPKCQLPIGATLNDALNNVTYEEGKPYLPDCVGFIDVNGPNLPNKEIECSNNVTTEIKPDTPCVVKNSDITDIFPVVFYDSTVAPASNAAAYVFNNAK
ncbi:type II secretion system protein [bacterium]|nr:type II secretion system protein [bacterium]